MKRGFDIVKNSWMWLGIGAVVMAVSLGLFFSNLNFSIEFTGGIQVQTSTPLDAASADTIETALNAQNLVIQDTSISQSDDISTLLIKLLVDDSEVESALEIIKSTLIEQGHIQTEDDIVSLSFIGPSIGDYIRKSAVTALILGVILMAIYMMISFGDIRKVLPPYVLAVITILTMLFDVSVPAGAYGALMAIDPTIQIDSIFVIAILTTIGYSINDTIIILDRIKENALADEKALVSGKSRIADLIDSSLWQTMRRSLGTSFSTLIVIITLYIIGSGVIKTFAFVMGWGIIAGTFSSIFIAATSLYVLTRKK
jgi:preprotein translocase SecF subunit